MKQRMLEKSCIKDLRLRIVGSQNDELECLKYNARKELNLPLSKTTLIRLAIFEFLENVKTSLELEEVLKKYKYI